MKELQECLNIKRQIDNIDEKIYKLKAVIYSPKNQIITGMPRGGNNENAVDRYLIKLEQLEGKKIDLSKKQKSLWQDSVTRIETNDQERELLYKRFVQGMPWKRCVFELNSTYGNWNINKAFRIYGKINRNF